MRRLNDLIHCRNSLFQNWDIFVPTYQLEFWETYKHYIGSTSNIKTYDAPKPKLVNDAVLFYSGGAESYLTKLMLDMACKPYSMFTLDAVYDKVTPQLKDELWYCGLALVLGYNKAYIGLEMVLDKDRYCFEWTPEFYYMFNKTFGTQYRSLVLDKTKIDVYMTLMKLGVNPDDINACKYNSDCNNCWKCFEKQAILTFIEGKKFTPKQREHYSQFLDGYHNRTTQSYPYLETLGMVIPHIL